MHANGLPTTGLASRVEDVVHSGAEAAAVLLDESRPTAFVCASDTLAMGVLHTLWIRQLAPGRDIAVVGFDDSQVAQVFPVGLTSVRQPLEDVAVEIVRTLRALLSHQPVEDAGRPPHADAGHPRVELTSTSTGLASASSPWPRATHLTRGDAVARRDDDFVAFVDSRSAALLRTARLLTAGDQHAAEDLVQTALERAYVAWPRIQRKAAQESYVRSIMTRAAIDRTRWRSRRGEVVTDEVPEVRDAAGRTRGPRRRLGPPPGSSRRVSAP